MALAALKLPDNTLAPGCRLCQRPISLHGAIMGTGLCRLCAQRARRDRVERITAGKATKEDLLRVKYAATYADKYKRVAACIHCGKEVRYKAKLKDVQRCRSCYWSIRYSNGPKEAKKTINLRIESSEKDALTAAAARSGLTINNFIRSAIIQAMTVED